jgi:hypothetical protein
MKKSKEKNKKESMHKNINLIKVKFIFIINLYFLPFGLAFKWHQRLVNKVLLEGRNEGIVLLSFGVAWAAVTIKCPPAPVRRRQRRPSSSSSWQRACH